MPRAFPMIYFRARPTNAADLPVTCNRLVKFRSGSYLDGAGWSGEDDSMVDAITAVSASSETTATRVESSLSITSEPDNKWVAARQSQIDADQVVSRVRHSPAAETSHSLEENAEEELPPLFEGHARRRKSSQGLEQPHIDEQEDAHLMSGESPLIGSTNFDEETPFGDRVAIV